MEIFKEIKGFEGKYLVSNYGNVKSVCKYRGTSERILKQYLHCKTGYLFVCLSKGFDSEKRKTTYKNYDVHRLVAETFLDNADGLPYVNHKDENKQNNAVDNLEWCTAKYNSNYGHAKEKICRGVLKYNKNGDLLAEFSSVQSAAADVGGSAGNISSCCKGTLKTAYGFIWKHK